MQWQYCLPRQGDFFEMTFGSSDNYTEVVIQRISFDWQAVSCRYSLEVPLTNGV